MHKGYTLETRQLLDMLWECELMMTHENGKGMTYMTTTCGDTREEAEDAARRFVREEISGER